MLITKKEKRMGTAAALFISKLQYKQNQFKELKVKVPTERLKQL